jgi:hypothetical protein
MHETYYDLVNFATACIFQADNPTGSGLHFSARPISEIFIEEDAQGSIGTVFRRFKMTALQATEKWGDDAPDIVKKQIADNAHFAKSTYLHYVRRNDDRIPDNIDHTGMPWASNYISLDEKTTLTAGGYFENPYHVTRWSKDAGEVMGRGPGWNALPGGKMLNAMKKTIIKAAQKQVDPPLAVEDDSVIGQLRTAPASINVIRATTLNRDPIRPFGNDGKVEIGIEMLNQERVQTRSAYHHELLQLIQDPRMTATQVVELASTMTRLLSPILGRQRVELLEPIVKRAYRILARQKKFPPAPAALQGQRIQVEYVSPVARAQRRAEGDAVIDAATVITNLSNVMPAVLDTLNGDEVARIITESRGAPLRILNPKDEVEAIRTARAQKQQQEEQRQQLIEGLETGAKVAPHLAALQGQGGNAAAA